MDDAAGIGIQSIICLLSKDELHDYYQHVGLDLLSVYRDRGFEVAHYPISDNFSAQQREEILPEIGCFYQRAPKPCLVHCNAGMTRTGTVIDYLLLHHADPPRS